MTSSLRREVILSASALLLAAVACATQDTDVGSPAGGGTTSFGGDTGGGGTPTGGSGALGGGGGSGSTGGSTASGGTGGDASVVDAPVDSPEDVFIMPDVVEAGDGSVGSGLAGARLELPCLALISSNSCSAGATSTPMLFEGDAGTTFDVTIRVRGVVELNSYSGGTADGHLYVGGMPAAAGWNVFSIDVSSPKQHYFLNNGGAGNAYCVAVDYVRTIKIGAGALVVLTADTNDNTEVRNLDSNGQAIVVASIPPAPSAFDGQFLQIDVESVTAN
jgi:hypothetical protein